MNDRDIESLLEQVRRVVRDEASAAAHYALASSLPRSSDPDAELLLIGAALYGKRARGVSAEDFSLDSHRELWEAAIEGGTWAEIRARLVGDEAAISVLYERIRAFEFATTEERQSAADRVVELAARRRLRALMSRLDVELAHGQIDAGDAEDELQRHLLRGYQ